MWVLAVLQRPVFKEKKDTTNKCLGKTYFVVYVDLEGNGTGDRPGVSGDASFLIPTGKFGGSLRPPSNSVRTH